MKKIISIILMQLMIIATNAANTDKTLVSWIKLNDNDVAGGSVLTIQNCDKYDGIVYTEEKGGKWIAASEQDSRTKRRLSRKIETNSRPSLQKFVQLAVVYNSNEIRIYRDHELYSSYKADNIDLLSGQKNFVVFGLDHFGGEGFISAEIEDARIYSSALTMKQIKSLKPDKPSAIKPYAWWDFEGDELKERTGRYVFHNTVEDENYELDNGKLKLKKWGTIIAIPQYKPETPEWPENQPDNWLTFHLGHPGPGWAEPGDPNPAYHYKGRYHLHYIYNNYFGFSYAHVSSKDMVHWKWHPTVLAPPNTGHGMFSGTGFYTNDGQPAMIYHGVGSGRNQLSLARDDLLEKWTSPEPIEATNTNGELADIHHWDPDCWQYNDTYYALSGGEDPELMKSRDLENWQYLGKLLHPDYPDNLGVNREEDISCANIFKIGNKWMLLCISHHLGCRYYLGDFKNEKYLPDFHAKMNWINTDWEEGSEGLVYFAPESMLTEDGRRVMWAWMMADIAPTGVQSLPRELELPEDGILRIKPLRELKSLRYGEINKEEIIVKEGKPYKLSEITGDALELNITFTAPLPQKFGINLLGDENNTNKLTISYGSDQKALSIGNITPHFELNDGENLNLRIFIDKNVVEVFANNRQACAIAHDHIRKDPNVIIFTKNKDLSIKEINAWKMKSIYQGDTVF